MRCVPRCVQRCGSKGYEGRKLCVAYVCCKASGELQVQTQCSVCKMRKVKVQRQCVVCKGCVQCVGKGSRQGSVCKG